SRASRVFTRLAEAEARVHNVPVEKIHFHEVGAMDAIIDVVGACVGFELLGVERFAASPLHVGAGMVEMAHGRFPVPPPAVAELLRDAPTYATDIQGELVTPTGAAIISTVCDAFGAQPAMRVEAVGYGAGTREYERFPNALRVMVGESDEDGASEKLLVVETNLDDASPQIVGHLMERAFERGALDCYFTPAQMKKNRPGVLVSILCRPAEREAFYQLLFDETTTLGVRSHAVERRAQPRESVLVETEFGAIRVKVARSRGRVVNATPEYDDCRAAARRFNAPLRDVEAAARSAYLKTVTSDE
ncbi:MAG: nickel pincer cofactor biosynthesis protein LarC, partial [Pyrinomonadaceae bacterium]